MAADALGASRAPAAPGAPWTADVMGVLAHMPVSAKSRFSIQQ